MKDFLIHIDFHLQKSFKVIFFSLLNLCVYHWENLKFDFFFGGTSALYAEVSVLYAYTNTN